MALAYFRMDGPISLGYKGAGLFGNAISAVPSLSCPLGVSVKYRGGDARTFIWWIENFDNGRGYRGPLQVEQDLNGCPGFRPVHTTRDINVLGFSVYLHTDKQLKVQCLHFRGDFPGSERNDPERDEYTYRSGLFLHDG